MFSVDIDLIALLLMQDMHSLANFFCLPASLYSFCRFTKTQEAVRWLRWNTSKSSQASLLSIIVYKWSKFSCPLLWQPQDMWEFLRWPPHLPLWFEEQGRHVLPLCLWLIVPARCECWRSFHWMWGEVMYPTDLQAFLKKKKKFSLSLFNIYHIILSRGELVWVTEPVLDFSVRSNRTEVN